ncbi:MAG: sulfotransferase domain-containing protein [Thermomicrobiales bacterium]|nr:sulfotransferase domain-containing protein [Thermomicrobiales bacterium]
MRIVITSPPKMGNKWLKCLLGTIYGLDWLLGDDTPATNPSMFEKWIADGNFDDDTIFHQHCRYSSKLCDVIEAVPAHAVTIVRDPYDTFVSMFYWLQTRASSDKAKGKVRPQQRPKDLLIGKPIDDPEVLGFLAETFGEYLRRANEWTHCGRTVVARYEELHRDPLAELTRVTDAIQPAPQDVIERAIVTCRADNMRAMSKKMSQHIRSAKVGDSRERLSQAHFDIFRDRYSHLVESLGYEVR